MNEGPLGLLTSSACRWRRVLDPLGGEGGGAGALVADPGAEFDVPLLWVLTVTADGDCLDVLAGDRRCPSRS
jgi:hypothetical protein